MNEGPIEVISESKKAAGAGLPIFDFGSRGCPSWNQLL